MGSGECYLLVHGKDNNVTTLTTSVRRQQKKTRTYKKHRNTSERKEMQCS